MGLKAAPLVPKHILRRTCPRGLENAGTFVQHTTRLGLRALPCASQHTANSSSSVALCLSAHCELGLLKYRTTPLGALRPPGTDPLTSCDGRGPHFEPPAWWRKRPAFRTRSASRHRRDHLELAAPLGTVGPDPRSPPTPFSAEGYFRSCCTACTALRTRFSAAADTPLGVAGHPEGPADRWPCGQDRGSCQSVDDDRATGRPAEAAPRHPLLLPRLSVGQPRQAFDGTQAHLGHDSRAGGQRFTHPAARHCRSSGFPVPSHPGQLRDLAP